MKTGDTVLNRPTGETWVVAYADPENDRLAWCGWPPGETRLSDCDLVESASEEEEIKLLHELAAINTNDPRFVYARQELARRTR